MRRAPTAAILVLVLVAGLGLVGPCVGAADAVSASVPGRGRVPVPPVDRVLILSVPTLDWGLVDEERPPALTGLFARGAVASLSVRAVGPRTTLAEGYATLGAGTRAAGQVEAEAALVDAGEVSPPVVSGLDEVVAANQALGYGAVPGALGQALGAAGRRSAVVANADVLGPTGARRPHREAALALMDEAGRVDAGTVGPELAVTDPGVGGGLRTDIDATLAAFSAAWSAADVVLLEASDLARADLAPAPAGPPGDQARRRALARADALVAAALDEVDLDRHLVVVVAPLSGRPGGDGLTVAAVAGPGVAPGLATSASTNRAGYVALTDVAPTVLAALGLEAPASMVGAAVTGAGGRPPGPASFEALAVAGEVSSFRDDATGPFSVAFVVLQVLTYGLAAAALARWPRLAPVVGFLALVTLALPPLTFLSGLVRYDKLGVVGYVVALFAAGAVLAGAALASSRVIASRTGAPRPLVAPLLLVGLTLAVLVGDVVAGAPLQLDTVFGYSPIVAGRFTGLGNLAFALVSMSALVVATGVWAVAAVVQGAPAPRPRRLWLAGVAVALATVVVADGHPALGADVGGVLALVPAALVVVVLLGGGRLRPGHAVAVTAVTVAVVVSFAAVDLARPVAERTHVGRFAAQVLDGGDGVAMVIERKIGANLSLLSSSVWALAIPVALAFLVFLLRRRRAILGRLQADVPGLRACLVAAVVLAVLGGGLNDSGVAVPAMMLAVLLPYVTVLAVSPPFPPAPAERVGAGDLTTSRP